MMTWGNTRTASRTAFALYLSIGLVVACSDSSSDEPSTKQDATSINDAGINDVQVSDDIPVNDVTIEDTESRNTEDAKVPWDLGPEADLTEQDPDVPNKTPDVFTSCPALGISPHWKGEFEGIVTYDLQGGSAVGSEPMKGLFMVSGDLEFEIKCLDQKLMVAGALDGVAEAAGEVGQHPFAANLFGDFNYIDRTIKANILDGEVRLFKVVSVFFEGNFTGAVKPSGNFDGKWDAIHTGNDLNVEGESSAYGNWNALPAPKPKE